MAKTTTNKSFRQDNPIKAQRRAALDDGETNERRDVPGASGEARTGPRRPGRAASLRSVSQRTRSQRWRAVAKGKVARRANPASRTRAAKRA